MGSANGGAFGAASESVLSTSILSGDGSGGAFFVRGVCGDVERARSCLNKDVIREIGREWLRDGIVGAVRLTGVVGTSAGVLCVPCALKFNDGKSTLSFALIKRCKADMECYTCFSSD
jgi:hypothetical protein